MKTKEIFKDLLITFFGGFIINLIFTLDMKEIINNPVIIFSIRLIILWGIALVLYKLYYKLDDKKADKLDIDKMNNNIKSMNDTITSITDEISKRQNEYSDDYNTHNNMIHELRKQVKELENKSNPLSR